MPTVWRESGMDVGYWTSGNEAWFVKRFEDIMYNNAQPVTASRWKERLKYNVRDTRKMENVVTGLSREMLL